MSKKSKNWKRRRVRQVRMHIAATIAAITIFAAGIWGLNQFFTNRDRDHHAMAAVDITDEKKVGDRPELDVQLLPINEYSRPGRALEQVNGIVVHYTANPGSTAQQNRDYFAGLAESHKTSASSHFIIGLDGEIVQCIPCNEIAYASNDRNHDTIAIECCIADDTGKFNKKTYDSLVELVSWLMGRYDLGTDAVIRHYDVTGKNCPKYFVEHPAKWDAFKEDLSRYIELHGTDRTE